MPMLGLENDAPSTISRTDDFRRQAALVAMHGELASQGGGVDWSGRPDELAELAVSYADELVRVFGDSGYNANAKKGGLP